MPLGKDKIRFGRQSSGAFKLEGFSELQKGCTDAPSSRKWKDGHSDRNTSVKFTMGQRTDEHNVKMEGYWGAERVGWGRLRREKQGLTWWGKSWGWGVQKHSRDTPERLPHVFKVPLLRLKCSSGDAVEMQQAQSKSGRGGTWRRPKTAPWLHENQCFVAESILGSWGKSVPKSKRLQESINIKAVKVRSLDATSGKSTKYMILTSDQKLFETSNFSYQSNL